MSAARSALPWMSFGSDAESQAPEGVFLKSSTHPRAYGNFARLLGKYVRDEKALPLADAIRRLTSLPADNLELTDRGCAQARLFRRRRASSTRRRSSDHATFDKPQQYATGVRDVFVNGVQVLQGRRAHRRQARPRRARPGLDGLAGRRRLPLVISGARQ